jgi:hypothetical protein
MEEKQHKLGSCSVPITLVSIRIALEIIVHLVPEIQLPPEACRTNER